MADESGAGGIAKGLTKTINAATWTGAEWNRTGWLLASWLVESAIRPVPHTCVYCRTAISEAVKDALTNGPKPEDVEHLVTREQP